MIHFTIRDVLPGDVNNDGAVDLVDVSLCLKACAGMTTPPLDIRADVNADRRIGSEEGLFAMQAAAGMWPDLFGSLGDAGLVAHYPFEGNADDAGGNGHHGTLVNGPVFQAGVQGQALYLDGFDDYVAIPASADFKTEAFSVCAFVKSESHIPFRAVRYIFEAGWPGDGRGNGHALVLSNDYQLTDGISSFMFSSTGGSAQRLSSDDTPYQTWRHYCYTYDGEAMRIYVDGVEQNQLAVPGIAYADSPADFLITVGNDSNRLGEGHGFTGWVDELRVYDRALSQPEIQELGASQ
jgi:hypothetical protein